MDNVIQKNEMSPLAALMQNAAARQLLAMLGIAASVALGVAVILWTRGPSYQSLYADQPPAAAKEMYAALTAAGIDAKFGNDVVTVPAKDMDRAKELLALEGLPAQSGTGLEMMDKIVSKVMLE